MLSIRIQRTNPGLRVTKTLGRVGAGLVLTVCAAVGVSPSQASFRAKLGVYGPQGEVYISRPTLRITMQSADGLPFTSGEMKVNGERVNATYDAERGALLYRPPQSFKPGPVEVDVRMTFGRQATFPKRWTVNVDPNAIPDYPAAMPSQIEIMKLANNFRRDHKLEPLEVDAGLMLVAQKHTEYLVQNDEVGHAQTPGRPKFFGRTLQERLHRYGWMEEALEGNTRGEDSLTSAMTNLTTAPYHRVPFLRPGRLPFGGAREGATTTVLFGSRTASGHVKSPGNGQMNVPLSWNGFESPNPLAVHGVRPGLVGYPIVFSVFGDSGKLSGVTANLRANGEEIPCFINSPLNDPRLSSDIFLIPREPLAPNTKYTVAVQATTGSGIRIDETWSFTTER